MICIFEKKGRSFPGKSGLHCLTGIICLFLHMLKMVLGLKLNGMYDLPIAIQGHKQQVCHHAGFRFITLPAERCGGPGRQALLMCWMLPGMERYAARFRNPVKGNP